MLPDRTAVTATLRAATNRLLERMEPAGHWQGHLSSSALSTAVATAALAQVDRDRHEAAIARGVRWLVAHGNADGGWGDTIDSPSNLSTTLLVWATLGAVPGPDGGVAEAAARRWLEAAVGALTPAAVSAAITARYGVDRTFSVPIVALCAVTGRFGSDEAVWAAVPQLPFELAVLPHAWLPRLRLPVVSYALPALIAMGLLRHRRRPTGFFPAAWWRRLAEGPVLRKLERLQPTHGGFLEAAPLTAFVALALAAAGLNDAPVVRNAVDFLQNGQRSDGSWPIDTNLSTWVTTLALKALPNAPDFPGPSTDQRQATLAWLLHQQTTATHPFTQAPAGGWGWTDLPGSVPDADDTAGALLALRRLDPGADTSSAAGAAGIRWLLATQNRDGGIPTFCRGWGQLPFDRSCPEITAHAILALTTWQRHLPSPLAGKAMGAVGRALRYLCRVQNDNGTWDPLWFGNQAARDHANPTYGTARVLIGLRPLLRQVPLARTPAEKAVNWLQSTQCRDGGWGGAPKTPPTVEETALAIDALAGLPEPPTDTIARGVRWLTARLASSESLEPAPIGLYFARLWYSEELYPLLFAVSALDRVRRIPDG